MHSFYLRNMYLNNLLKEPGGLEVAGVPIDLSKIKVPTYFISTIEDHIAPWKSTYSGARHFGGNVRFVLGGSGHIAGIVNPPAANKYGYWTTAASLADRPGQHQGSRPRPAQGHPQGARGRTGLFRQGSPRRQESSLIILQ